jgi:hypothetical protein
VPDSLTTHHTALDILGVLKTETTEGPISFERFMQVCLYHPNFGYYIKSRTRVGYGEGTDFYAVKQGYAAITPLQMDLTSYAQLDDVRGWMMDQGAI